MTRGPGRSCSYTPCCGCCRAALATQTRSCAPSVTSQPPSAAFMCGVSKPQAAPGSGAPGGHDPRRQQGTQAIVHPARVRTPNHPTPIFVRPRLQLPAALHVPESSRRACLAARRPWWSRLPLSFPPAANTPLAAKPSFHLCCPAACRPPRPSGRPLCNCMQMALVSTDPATNLSPEKIIEMKQAFSLNADDSGTVSMQGCAGLVPASQAGASHLLHVLFARRVPVLCASADPIHSGSPPAEGFRPGGDGQRGG